MEIIVFSLKSSSVVCPDYCIQKRKFLRTIYIVPVNSRALRYASISDLIDIAVSIYIPVPISISEKVPHRSQVAIRYKYVSTFIDIHLSIKGREMSIKNKKIIIRDEVKTLY